MWFRIVGAVALLLGGLAASAATAAERVGTTQASFVWEPASGEVDYYEVWISRGGPFELDPNLRPVEPRLSLTVEPGEELSLRVAARGFDGQRSPLSPPSEPLRVIEPNRAVPGDVDGDGAPDVVVRETGAIQVLASLATDGLSAEPPLLLGVLSPELVPVGTGDFDANGVTDLVLRDGHAGLEVALVLTDGSLQYRSIGQLDPEWRLAAVGDWDGDQRDDLLWEHRDGSLLFLRMLDGHPRAVHPLDRENYGHWLLLGAEDFTGDGTPDLLWRLPSGALTAVWEMDGFSRARRGKAGSVPDGAGPPLLADFDGDGASDVAWPAADGSEIEIWFYEGVYPRRAETLVGDYDRRLPVNGADYDGDGRADLLLKDATSGGLHVQRLDGAFVLSDTALGFGASTWEVLGAP